jgi:hypothetical protein
MAAEKVDEGNGRRGLGQALYTGILEGFLLCFVISIAVHDDSEILEKAV